MSTDSGNKQTGVPGKLPAAWTEHMSKLSITLKLYVPGKVPTVHGTFHSFKEAADFAWNMLAYGDDMWVMSDVTGTTLRVGEKDDLDDMEEWEETWE